MADWTSDTNNYDFLNVVTTTEDCFLCQNDSSGLYSFTCSHKICSICLYRVIFCNYITNLQNKEILIVKCKCTNGQMDLNLTEINEIIKKKSEIDTQNEEYNIICDQFPRCKTHNAQYKNFFCWECNQNVCPKCSEVQNSEHFFHKNVECVNLIHSIKKNLSELPIKFINEDVFQGNFDVIGQKLKENAENNYNNTMTQINELIKTVKAFRQEYEENYRKQLARAALALKVIRLLYLNFFYDWKKSEQSNDVNLLRFVKNISYEFLDIKIEHDLLINQKINAAKTTLENLRKDVGEKNINISFDYCPVSKGYKCEDSWYKVHGGKITGWIQTKNDQLITCSYDKTIHFWKDSNDGYCKHISISSYIRHVKCMWLWKDERLVSSSRDKKNQNGSNINQVNDLRVWIYDNRNYICQQTWNTNNQVVKSWVQVDDSRWISGSNTEIIIWREDDGMFKNVQNIKGSGNRVLDLYDGKFLTTGKSGWIRWWGENEKSANNINSEAGFKNIGEWKRHKEQVSVFVQLTNGQIWSGTKKGVIIRWSWIDGKYQPNQKLNKDENNTVQEIAHDGCVTGILQLKDFRVATSSLDKTIKIWKRSETQGNLKYYWNENICDYPYDILKIIELYDGRICAATKDNSIIFWRNREAKY